MHNSEQSPTDEVYEVLCLSLHPLDRGDCLEPEGSPCPDPRRAQGRRHPLPTVLAIASGAILCGMRGYEAISDQPTLFQDIQLYFQDRKEPDFIVYDPPDHGRIETRKIWTTTELNPYLDFPHGGQAFVIERESVEKKTGKTSHDIAYGITSRKPDEANAQQLLAINRSHWSIENSCHYILDWNFDEDRSRIRTGYGPENISRLRRFAIGLIKAKGVRSVAQKMRELTCNVRLVFDYFRMTKNACTSAHL